MELETTKVRVVSQMQGQNPFKAAHAIHFTTPDGREHSIPCDWLAAQEFNRLVVRVTPMEKL